MKARIGSNAAIGLRAILAAARNTVRGIAVIVTASTVLLGASTARSQDYPARPVRVVVGFPAGGGLDVPARLISQWLSQRLGQQFFVENRVGGAGNIATEAVIRAPADGYTLLLVSTTNAINPALYPDLQFDFIHDIAPVAGIYRVPFAMGVSPSFPCKTVNELVAYAKANPGKVNVASPGLGTPQFVTGELFKMMTGVDIVLVNYREPGVMLADLLGGQVQVMFENLAVSIPNIKAGKLRALAVTSAARADALPDVPTVGESVPGFAANGWTGIGAPRGTPPEIVAKLNREINAALADPDMREKFANLGVTLLPGSPADFAKHIAEETEKWAKVVRFSGAKIQ
jgi:tripartite-type tricarboxylate transporter receptor subunit TctC